MTLEVWEFEKKFNDLLLLSREGFEEDKLDSLAEKYGKKSKKESVDKQLLADFTNFRDMLSRNITRLNSDKNLTEGDLDESVQRILDRLIFIRNCEDRELEPRNLISNYRQWTSRGRGKLVKSLREDFAYFNEEYNSKLFAEHLCDSLEIDNEVLEDIIVGLYFTKDRAISYDFSIIDADILGTIYEQYLGRILKKTEKRAKITKSHAHRKKQGIYYTPTYVVDYIVRNTLGEKLKEKVDVETIKILDPACGSGSFLIKSFDVLNEYYKKRKDYGQTKFDEETSTPYKIKEQILKNNIFGVDLDAQAVEIAQLNLLLKIAEKGQKLPLLQQNIKMGDSLIDSEYVSEKAFKWEKQFKDVISNGCFDIIVGNPPYVDIKQLNPTIVAYLFEKYSTVENRMNLYSTFVDRAISLLRENGLFGFIIPNSILYNESYGKIRKKILTETTIEKIARLPDNIFEGVKIETIILILRKRVLRGRRLATEVIVYPRSKVIKFIGKDNCPTISYFNQNIWKSENIINITSSAAIKETLAKIEKDCSFLLNVCDFSLGLTPYDKYKGHTQQQIRNRVFHSNKKENVTFKPLLSGQNITRYQINWDGNEYISYGNWLGAPRQKRFFTHPRIVVRQIISGVPPRIYAGYSQQEFYNSQIGFNLLSKNENDTPIKYILALLNSKMMTFYHKEKYLDPTKTLFQKILIANAKKFPIRKPSNVQKKSIVQLVNKMLTLKEREFELRAKQTTALSIVREEIETIDNEIDDAIYRIYGITDAEKEIIESSFK